MSDFRVRVRYHDIEVEIAIPMSERDNIEPKVYTGLTAIEMVKEATKQVEALIIAGRKEVAP
jgi:hypothetical protein